MWVSKENEAIDKRTNSIDVMAITWGEENVISDDISDDITDDISDDIRKRH